jgi:Uma2 family endonuclease
LPTFDVFHTVTDMSLAAAHEGAFTVDDLDQFPEDGLRYELIEGTLIVTATPSDQHQVMVAKIFHALHEARTTGLMALPGPMGVQSGTRTLFQPDVLVVRTSAIGVSRAEAPPPLLVVEVASPSTRMIDRGTKRLAYRDAGVGAYWMADPFEPAVTVIRWDGDDEHEQVVVGEDTLTVDFPFPVELCPAALVTIDD